MDAIIVSTKAELESALKAGTKRITVVGPYAEQIAMEYQKRHKKTKIAKIASGAGAVVICVVSIAAVPVTGGISLAGLTASAALTVGTVTISAAELAIICGFALGMYGLSKGYKVKFNPNGSVELSK